MKGEITNELIKQALSYKEYQLLTRTLLEQDKTTGPNQSEAYINYTRLAEKRMAKWNKIGKLLPDLIEKLQKIEQPMTWLVLTEAWCGDAGQSLPFMQKMVEHNANLKLKLLIRDEHPELMERFLTNGAKSIPKLIALNKELQVLGTWGPRPEPIQQEFLENKQSQKMSGQAFSEYMHLWYAKDKGLTMQLEFLAILEEWTQKLQSSPGRVASSVNR